MLARVRTVRGKDEEIYDNNCLFPMTHLNDEEVSSRIERINKEYQDLSILIKSCFNAIGFPNALVEFLILSYVNPTITEESLGQTGYAILSPGCFLVNIDDDFEFDPAEDVRSAISICCNHVHLFFVNGSKLYQQKGSRVPCTGILATQITSEDEKEQCDIGIYNADVGYFSACGLHVRRFEFGVSTIYQGVFHDSGLSGITCS